MADEFTTIRVMQRINGPRTRDIRKITQLYISKRFKDTVPPPSIIIESQFVYACSDFLYFGKADNYSKANRYRQDAEALENAAAVLEDGDVRWFYPLPDTINMLKLMAGRYKELAAMFNKNPSHVNFFWVYAESCGCQNGISYQFSPIIPVFFVIAEHQKTCFFSITG